MDVIESIKLGQIPSLMAKKELFTLYETSKLSKGNAVEIGSWIGGSTIVMARGMGNNRIVYAVDPFMNTQAHRNNQVDDTFDMFRNNIRKFGVENQIVVIKKMSDEAAKSWKNGNVGMLCIDGDHEYDGAMADVKNWIKYLDKDGFLLMHDFGINGDVADVVMDYVVHRMRFVKRMKSLVVFANDGKTGFYGRLYLNITKFVRKFVDKRRKNPLIKLLLKMNRIMVREPYDPNQFNFDKWKITFSKEKTQ